MELTLMSSNIKNLLELKLKLKKLINHLKELIKNKKNQ